MNDREALHFLRQFARLLNAGIPLTRALNIILAQGRPKARAAIGQMVRSVESGETFSRALFGSGVLVEFVPSFTIAERDGSLEKALLRAAEQIERKRQFKENLKRSLAYPAIVLAMSAVCLVFLLFVILPNLSRMLADLNCPLPPVTRMVLLIADNWMTLVFGFILAGAAAFRHWRNIDRRFKLPIIGKILFNLELADLCYNLSSRLKAGVPILEGLRSTGAALKSPELRASVLALVGSVKNGSSLSDALLREKVFPAPLVQMAAVGEESGSLADMIFSAAEMYEAEGERGLKALALYIEPAATLTVGLAVGVVVLAVMLPLFSMMGSLL